MLAVFMLPVATIVYLMVFGVLYENFLRRREEACFLVTGLLTGAFIGAWWLLLWRGSVRWSRFRLAGTAAAVVAALAVGGLAGWLMHLIEDDLGAFLFGPAAIFAWLIMTVFLWRETAGERAARLAPGRRDTLVCPACGYNMTGLGTAVCPECGARYAIDELIAAQPSRAAEELDKPAA